MTPTEQIAYYRTETQKVMLEANRQLNITNELIDKIKALEMQIGS